MMRMKWREEKEIKGKGKELIYFLFYPYPPAAVAVKPLSNCFWLDDECQSSVWFSWCLLLLLFYLLTFTYMYT